MSGLISAVVWCVALAGFGLPAAASAASAVNLGTLGGSYSGALAVNDRGPGRRLQQYDGERPPIMLSPGRPRRRDGRSGHARRPVSVLPEQSMIWARSSATAYTNGRRRARVLLDGSFGGWSIGHARRQRSTSNAVAVNASGQVVGNWSLHDGRRRARVFLDRRVADGRSGHARRQLQRCLRC